ncbi:exosome catalytic subunit dis3 [Dimargaris cristalligena]|uniref:Ribosomal RNA-processing protein 44 n=1 Tax=Dimargaris cristalligena TaxID=215637 RepID=A0A4P9ZP39_9FUNG|nr:exosome catalytic subunit dis3 [Dimargaris cristalligena]RKP35083.1 hypothetical protein BJ085DRAFT_14923 [Dimargaris cristalligena]|eukprot:RKP35083.1 hypothetical protein BJ085DRAFT_14923 [Dimargaris cristalligena]
MLRSKSYMKKTRKGNVVRVVTEHYLRDDIVCSVEKCPNCDWATLQEAQGDSKFTVPHPVLSSTPRQTESFPVPTLVVPDTNVLYHQIDILEHPALTNVVILQTCLSELKNLSMPTYHRLRNIISDPDRHFYVFSNENHRETFIERLKEETPNDRNDRAIRRAVQWYNQHLSQTNRYPRQIKAMMLSDDADNRRKATADGIPNASVMDYLQDYVEYPELIDMVSQASVGNDKGDQRVCYDEHLTKLQVQSGLKSGKYVQGTLGISTHNFLEGSILGSVDGETRAIVIIGRSHMNRAVHGDVIAVELLPRSEWQRTPTAILIEEDEDEVEDDTPVEGTAGKTKQTSKGTPAKKAEEAAEVGEAKPTGKVVGIVRRNWRPYCGHLESRSVRSHTQAAGSQSVMFAAMDKRIPKIKVRTRQAHQLLGQRIVVNIDSWPRDSKYPLGHFVRALGSAGDRATETEVLLMEHDVPYQEFSKQVLSDLPVEGESWVVQDHHLEGRVDYRGLDVCSIDPPGCTDIDDALHCVKLPNGNYQVGVHIADVTHFVKPDMHMDKEAAVRCTTVYLVDRRIDMLPALLGTNLCSLHCNVERLAFSCVWELDPEANIVQVSFSKSVIRSRNSFTYDEAQARIDDQTLNDPVTLGVRSLNQLAKKLRQRRMDQGALTLSSPEVRFNLENDSQDPVDVEMKELKDTNALVEEFMLLANISVAKRIYESYPDTSMLRRHPTPPPSNFEWLSQSLRENGFELNSDSSKTLSDSLDKAVKANDPYFNKLVRIMATRSMMQAVYFCSGTLPPEDYHHYGLATPIYTHFTSPIRRYADVLVHRLLEASINPQAPYIPMILDKSRMKDQSDTLNYRNRMAQQAARSSVELYTHLFFRNKEVYEPGYVTRVLQNGFSVLVPKYGIEGFVYAAEKKVAASTEILVYDPSTNTLNNPETGITITTFAPVHVRITVEQEGLNGLKEGEGAGSKRDANATVKNKEPAVKNDEPTLREKMQMRLVTPFIPGLSVQPQGAVDSKSDDTATTTPPTATTTTTTTTPTTTAAPTPAANGESKATSSKKRKTKKPKN